jgi:hypothetical protein
VLAALESRLLVAVLNSIEAWIRHPKAQNHLLIEAGEIFVVAKPHQRSRGFSSLALANNVGCHGICVIERAGTLFLSVTQSTLTSSFRSYIIHSFINNQS